MQKIEKLSLLNTIIYSGAFDLNNEGKIIKFKIDSDELILDLNKAVNSNRISIDSFDLKKLFELCSIFQIICTIYPNGHISFKKLNPTNELNSCYISSIDSPTNKYLVCIAFDETQPTLYKAELLSIIRI